MFERMPRHGKVLAGGCSVTEVSTEEVSCRVSIDRGTIPRAIVSLSSIHKKVSVRETSGYQFIITPFSKELF